MTTTFYLFNPLYIHEIEEKTSLKIKKKYLSPIDHLGKGDYFASIYDLNDNYLFDVSSLFGSFNEKDDIWANSNEVVEINIDKDINNIPIETRIGLQNLIENLNIIFIDYYEYDKLYYQKKSDVEIDTDINYDEYDDYNLPEEIFEKQTWIDWMKKNKFVNIKHERNTKINKIIK